MHRAIPIHQAVRPAWAILGLVAAVLAGCSTKMPDYSQTVRRPEAPSAVTAIPVEPPPLVAIAPPAAPPKKPNNVSDARKAADYRRHAAEHLYSINAQRIFKGKLPEQLYAVGVLDIDIDRQGSVTAMRWVRAPAHAPEVIAAIEKAVRDAVPFPAPVRMGRVTYNDIWLWHKDGSFQLDTLTEGQH